jgi:hypothetical protein
MNRFSSLEHAAINAILGDSVERRAIIEQQMIHSDVTSHDNTGTALIGMESFLLERVDSSRSYHRWG